MPDLIGWTSMYHHVYPYDHNDHRIIYLPAKLLWRYVKIWGSPIRWNASHVSDDHTLCQVPWCSQNRGGACSAWSARSAQREGGGRGWRGDGYGMATVPMDTTWTVTCDTFIAFMMCLFLWKNPILEGEWGIWFFSHKGWCFCLCWSLRRSLEDLVLQHVPEQLIPKIATRADPQHWDILGL